MITLAAIVSHEHATGMGKVIYITPHVVGRPDVTYTSFVLEENEKNKLLATRLAAAIEGGVAFSNVFIETVAGGQDYITAKEEFSIRRLTTDLRRLGY
jgi:hypothetical protein